METSEQLLEMFVEYEKQFYHRMYTHKELEYLKLLLDRAYLTGKKDTYEEEPNNIQNLLKK